MVCEWSLKVQRAERMRTPVQKAVFKMEAPHGISAYIDSAYIEEGGGSAMRRHVHVL
jgi:hypothetical protein